AGTEDPGAHGADGTSHDLGDLLVAEAVHFAQGDGHAQLLRQIVDRRGDMALDLLAEQFVLRGGPVLELRIGGEVHGILDGDVVAGRAPALRHQVVLGGVYGDLVHPGVERAVTTTVPQGTVGT